MSILQRLVALERMMGAVPDSCRRCGAPHGGGVILLNEGEQPGECALCGGETDHSGRGVAALLPNGVVSVTRIVLHEGTVPG